MMFHVSDLPALNAELNGTSAILLAFGFWAVRRRRWILHRNLMLIAIFASTLFLISYLTYHAIHGHEVYRGPFRSVYLVILFSHTILAILVLPLVLVTMGRALKAQKGDSHLMSPEIRSRFIRHRAIARWTFPIWMYVSITGVVVYWMLYQLPKHFR